jgi:hypothetical protein
MYTVRKYHIVLKDEMEITITSLPKFNGDVRFWPSFLAIYCRQTQKCQFNQSENMQRLRDGWMDC